MLILIIIQWIILFFNLYLDQKTLTDLDIKSRNDLRGKYVESFLKNPKASEKIVQNRAIIAANNPAELYEGGSDELDYWCSNNFYDDFENVANARMHDERFKECEQQEKECKEKLKTEQNKPEKEKDPIKIKQYELKIENLKKQKDWILKDRFEKNKKFQENVTNNVLYCSAHLAAGFLAGQFRLVAYGVSTVIGTALDGRSWKCIREGDVNGLFGVIRNNAPVFGAASDTVNDVKEGDYKGGLISGVKACIEGVIWFRPLLGKFRTGKTNLSKQGKVKQLGPMGDPAGRSILYKPKGWITKVSKNNKGTKILNPNVKDGSDYIRFSPKNPDARAPAGQQYNYFERYKNGKVLTKDGQWVDLTTHPNKQDLHIPPG